MILTILTFAIVAYFSLWLPTFLTLRPEYKYYKQTYLAIKNKEYLLFNIDESFIIFKPKGKMNQLTWDEEIIYFKSSKSIKLTNGFINRTFIMTLFDPYTQYWYKKIKKEILINSRTLAQIREDKLKQLLK
jgi:hypothetical protein